MTSLRLVAVVALLLGLSWVRSAAAQQPDPELEARTDFAAGRYQKALDSYARLYAQTMHPTYIRNVGRCYQRMGKPDEAIDAFREYLGKAQNLDVKSRSDVEGFIREMEDLKRRQEESHAKTVAPLTVAGAPPTIATASVNDAQTTSALTLTASPASTPSPTPPIYARWWFWTTVGALALGGVALGLALSSGGGGTPTPTLGIMDARHP